MYVDTFYFPARYSRNTFLGGAFSTRVVARLTLVRSPPYVEAERLEERRVRRLLGVEKGKVSRHALKAHLISDAAEHKIANGAPPLLFGGGGGGLILGSPTRSVLSFRPGEDADAFGASGGGDDRRLARRSLLLAGEGAGSSASHSAAAAAAATNKKPFSGRAARLLVGRASAESTMGLEVAAAAAEVRETVASEGRYASGSKQAGEGEEEEEGLEEQNGGDDARRVEDRRDLPAARAMTHTYTSSGLL